MYEKISIGFALVWLLGGTAFFGIQLLSAPTGAQTVAATVRLWLLVISPALLNAIVAAALRWSQGPPRVAASIWLVVFVILQLGAVVFFLVVRADARAQPERNEAQIARRRAERAALPVLLTRDVEALRTLLTDSATAQPLRGRLTAMLIESCEEPNAAPIPSAMLELAYDFDGRPELTSIPTALDQCGPEAAAWRRAQAERGAR